MHVSDSTVGGLCLPPMTCSVPSTSTWEEVMYTSLACVCNFLQNEGL